MTVLVVDDEPLLRELYATVLTRDGGFRVVAQCADGSDAVAAAAEHQPDIALLDVRIPGVRGIELLRALRMVAPACRPVMISGHTTDDMAARLVEGGAWDFVRKGEPGDELCRRLHGVAAANGRPGARAVVAPVPPPAPRPSPSRPRPVRLLDLPIVLVWASDRHRTAVATGWLVAALVVVAAVVQARGWDAEIHESVESAAMAEASVTAVHVAGHVEGRVAALEATATGLLAAEVDDDALAAAMLPLEVPFAIVLDVNAPAVLATLPPRDLDAGELIAEFPHIATAASGEVGVGRRLEGEDGRVGTSLAVPFQGRNGDARVLSTMLWLDDSIVGETLATASVGAPGAVWELRDGVGDVLAVVGEGQSGTSTDDVEVDVALEDLPWELAVRGPGEAFVQGFGTAHVVPVAVAIGVGSLAVLAAFGWHRLVRASRRLVGVNQELQELHDQQREFAAVTSHELRTPVTVVSGFAQTLLTRWDDVDDATRRTMIERLDGSARRLSGLVEDLMTTSLTQRGELQLVPQPMSVTALVQAAVQGSRLAGAPPAVHVDPTAMVHVDPTYGPRMLANLFDNAAKYGAPPVEVRTRRVGMQVEIVVRDHGEGVPPEFLGRLFEPYRQAERHERRRRGGIGLGLHTVSVLAEMSRGSVRHAAPDDGGAEFTLSLPCASPSPEVHS